MKHPIGRPLRVSKYPMIYSMGLGYVPRDNHMGLWVSHGNAYYCYTVEDVESDNRRGVFNPFRTAAPIWGKTTWN